MDRSIWKIWFGNGAILGIVSFTNAEAILKCAVLAATLAYTLIKCWLLVRSRGKKFSAEFLKAIIAPVLLAAMLTGCTFAGKANSKAESRRDANAEEIAEESRALTTGIVDALSVAPTNAPTDLALEMAKADQQLEGTPRERIDVPGALAGDRKALDRLAARLEMQGRLLEQKAALEVKLRDAQARLIEMGQKYEAEKNKNIVKRIWHWAFTTFGIGGLIALGFFFPALIPIAANAFTWMHKILTVIMSEIHKLMAHKDAKLSA